MAAKLFRALIALILKSTCKIEVVGLENVPAQGSCILAANHVGRLDAVLVYYLLERTDIIMTVAEKYGQVAFFRWAARALEAIFIDRFNPDIRALRAVIQRLNAGQLLAIAPEGTRSKTGTLIEGRHGTAYLASKTGAPVLPVALIGTQDHTVLANLRHFRRSPVRVIIGQPFTLPPLKRQGRDAQLAQYTDEIMCQIAARLPERSRGVYAKHPRLAALLTHLLP